MGKLSKNIILVLVMFMPFHTLICEYLLSSISWDNLWRDILIIILYIINRKKIKKSFVTLSVVLWILLAIPYLMSALLDSRVLIAMNIFRIYAMPLLLLIVVMNLNFDSKFIKKIVNLLFYQGILLSIYGIFQAYILGPEFLIKLGYQGVNGRLSSSSFYIGTQLSGLNNIQRVVSTFDSPNNCAFYLAMIVLALIILRHNLDAKRRIQIIGFAIIICAIVLTLSRTAMIVLFCGLIYYFLLNKSIFKKKINLKISTLKVIIIILSLSILAFFIDNRFLGNQTINSLHYLITKTIDGTDASAVVHFGQLYLPLFEMINRPFGFGLGYCGNIIYQIYGFAYTTESSIYLLMYETGIIGGLLYLYPLFKPLFLLKNKSSVNLLKVLSLSIIIEFMSLPVVQNATTMIIAFFFVAIGYSLIHSNEF